MAPSEEVMNDLLGLAIEPTDGAPAKESGGFAGNTSLWSRLHELGDIDNAGGSSIGSSYPLPSSHRPWSAHTPSNDRPRVLAPQPGQPDKLAVLSPTLRRVISSTTSPSSAASSTSSVLSLPRQWERPSVHDPLPGRPSNIPYSSRETEPAWFNTTTASILAAERAKKEEEKRQRIAAAKLIDDSEETSTTKGKKAETTTAAESLTIYFPTAMLPPDLLRQSSNRRIQEEPANKDPYSFW